MNRNKLNWIGIRRLIALMLLVVASVSLYTGVVCEQIGWAIFICALCFGFTHKIFKDS